MTKIIKKDNEHIVFENGDNFADIVIKKQRDFVLVSIVSNFGNWTNVVKLESDDLENSILGADIDKLGEYLNVKKVSDPVACIAKLRKDVSESAIAETMKKTFLTQIDTLEGLSHTDYDIAFSKLPKNPCLVSTLYLRPISSLSCVFPKMLEPNFQDFYQKIWATLR